MDRVIIVACFLLLSMFLIIPSGSCFTFPQSERRGIWYETEYRVSPDPTIGNNTLWNDFSFYAEYNITSIYFLVNENYVFYNSSVAPMHPNYNWDVLREACKIAGHFGLSIHAWIVVFRDWYLWNQNETIRMVDVNGSTSGAEGWVNPSIPEVRNYKLSLINEIIRNYDVKGIHLDYIRYPDDRHSYDNYSRTVFMSEYGFDPKDNPNAQEWYEWRSRQITSFVNETKILVKSFGPQLEVSCVVMPTTGSRIWHLQNWEEWANERLVDYLMTISYAADNTTFENWVKNSTQTIDKKVGLMPGIGIFLYANSANRNEILQKQWNIVRKYNCEGWVLFRDEFLPNFTDTLKHPPELSEPWQDPPPNNVQPLQNVTVSVNATYYLTDFKYVTLWYSLDNGTSWTILNMTWLPNTAITYEATIGGYENCIWVTYKIFAYDKAGNNATKDNNGYGYKYHVIPEYPSTPIFATFMLTTLVAATFWKTKRKTTTPP
ncbi:MAG: glycoside hydrolase family 10 protein [Candidatus Bathyarchaeales archaeon]